MIIHTFQGGEPVVGETEFSDVANSGVEFRDTADLIVGQVHHTKTGKLLK